MLICNWPEINRLAVKQVGKPAVYVCNHLELISESETEIWKFVTASVKKLYENKPDKFYDIMTELVSESLIFFDTEQEQEEFYQIFDQALTSSSAIYACTYSADGEAMNENT